MSAPQSVHEKAFAEKTDKTDAILVVDGKKLHVNKAVLSYHSEYFKALFNSASKEEYPIENVNFNDFVAVLSTVHGAPIKFDATQGEQLLRLADRFQLPAAKFHVELWLMAPEKARDYQIQIADEYNLEGLMAHVIAKYNKRESFYNGNYQPRTDVFDKLSDETNAKLFKRMVQVERDNCYSMNNKDNTPSMSVYEQSFAKSDKTDAVLVVQGKKIHVNKALFSHHSDYFKALFNSDFTEKFMKEIPIQNVKFEDFAALLSLVQEKPILPTENNVEKVLELADRFLLLRSVARLIEICLIADSKMENLEKIRIAEKNGMTDLLESAISGYNNRYKLCEVTDSFGYERLSAKTKKKLFYQYLKI